nr:serine/arginine repetitive matrix protein 2-like isoform X3 [Maniola hyperantus]
MSEADVSLIRDEDVLRRMWQQTEDFSRKKEIRTHMYRLREERLRSLYSPEPGADAKGCEFTTQGHVKSFADQNFQSMKSKEVRDASSPTKEFTYRGQDLKDLSNAGWNVESENRTTDDGRTHVKAVHANIEGKYDVDGGQGQFAAVDYNKKATTEYDDGKTSLKRNENVSNTAAHEQVVRKTKDGLHSSSTTSSSTATSKFEKVSTREAVPYPSNDDYDLSSQKSYNTNRNDKFNEITSQKFTKQQNTSEYDQNLRNDFNQGELVSRKVDYPDENTKVIVETRCLPDGTRVTSTRREFRAPSVQTSHSEQHSHQTRTENKSYETSQKRINETSSKIIRESTDDRNIVDSQKTNDGYDFKRNQTYSENKVDDYNQSTDKYKNHRRVDSHTTVDDYDYRKNEDNLVNKTNNFEKTTDQYIKQRKHETDVDDITRRDDINRREIITSKDDTDVRHHDISEIYLQKNIDERVHNITRENKTDDFERTTDQYRKQRKHETDVDDITRRDHVTRRDIITSKDDTDVRHRDTSEIHSQKNIDERVHNITHENKVVEKITSTDQYQSTYQTDYTQRKISNDLSPAHQAWASTLRSDTPTRPSTRASSPGSKTFKSSTSSLRSSISPDKTYRKPPSRGESPEKTYRKPASRGESPEKTYRTPVGRGESPEKTYRTPVGQGESRDKTYRKPASRGESPEKTYRTPGGRGESLDKTYRKPASRGESPENSYRTPTGRDDSPDKTYKKPLSRVESASATDRHSPSRTVSSDKYSTTESTTTVQETKLNKYSSAEERLQDNHRPRLSTSPEKPLHLSRPSPSPERKPENKNNVYERPKSPTKHVEKITTPQRWNSSPVDGRPTDFNSTLPKNHSPDRVKSDVQRELFRKDNDVIDKFPENSKTKPTDEPQRISSHEDKYPKSLSPTRSSTEPLQRYPKNPTRNASQEPEEISHNEPGYMRPTATSKPKLSDDSKLPSATSPTKNVPSKSPERKSSKPSINKISDQHYKFIDEETKMYTRDNNEELVHMIQKQTKNEVSTDYSENVNDTTKSRRSPSPDTYPKKRPSSPSKPSPASPVRQANLNDDSLTSKKSPTRNILTDVKSPDIVDSSPKSYPQKSPSPSRNKSPNSIYTNRFSPVKDNHTIITDNKDKQFTDSYDRKRSPTKDAPETYEPKYSSEKVDSQRKKAPSPSKFETYDLKRNTYGEEKRHSVKTTDETIERSKPEVRPDSPKIGRTPSRTPTTKSPRNSTSPDKSLMKDSKYKHTSDFIGTERTTEEINKTKLKERPRQLITPSTSPTRKPKDLEQAPSSGQSSPTTCVSGFVYYKSPKADKTIVTDLDEQDFNTEPRKVVTHAPKDDSTKDSPSSKLPCRSPSPEKRPTKESLPRKSSLKKSSITQISPTEKPPTSFVISPNVEIKEFTEHKVKINEHPDKEKDKPIKTKPPFERRETYEERCRKILGMIDTDSTETESVTKKNITSSKNLEANVSSPSVSPCRSPSPREGENLLFKENVKKTEIANTEESIIQESENKNKTTVSLSNITDTSKKAKTPSRDTSPTKLQDIMSNYEHEHTTESPLNKTKTEDYKKSSPTREIKNKPSHEPHELKSHLPKTNISPEKNNVKNNLTEGEVTDQTPKQKEEDAMTPEYPQKIGPHRRHDSPVRQTHDTIDKPTIASPKSNRSPSPPKKQIKPELSITKSEMQYATETINEAFVKNVTEVIVDETDYLSTGPIAAKPTRKIPVGKTAPTKNIDVKVGNKTVSTTKSAYNSEFIVSEKEREELDRIQKLPKQHSPDRFGKSPTDKKTPFKSVTLTDEEVGSDNNIENQMTITKETTIENDDTTHIEKQKRDKVKDQKIANKPLSRNVSPTKKISNVSPASTRSISPKKTQSPVERPQSPQVTKISGIKPRDQVPSHIRKPSPSGPSPTKTDKTITTDIKKLNTTKSSTTKVSTNKTTQSTVNRVLEQEPKKSFAPKGTKDVEIKVTRTASDTTLKTKKTLPQRMRSKPEIQVNDKVTKQTTTTNKYQKYSPKDSQTKLPTNKPKSATALNTSTDEDDVIIDVQQAKSSRENSPDRICPTPVGFLDDVGTPRFPDEVNEPDDEYHSRTHRTIHETESIVDDIVEICEDDELFVKKNGRSQEER